MLKDVWSRACFPSFTMNHSFFFFFLFVGVVLWLSCRYEFSKGRM